MPGKARLARWVLRGGLDMQDVELTTRLGDTLVVPHLREPVAFDLLVHGSYEPETLAFILHHLAPGGTYVEVGANVGTFCIAAARKVGTAGRVLAVEASLRVFPYLKLNLERNGAANVTAVACAASDHDADAVPFWEAPADHFGMGSLAGQFHDAPTSVACRTLDGLLAEHALARVDVLKVDVEGFEAAVFRGARQLLTGPQPPVVVFEFVDWAERRSGAPVGAAQELMLQYGFRLSHLDRGDRLGPPLAKPLTEGAAMVVAVREGEGR
jgi:FkbM family methyltransferase